MADYVAYGRFQGGTLDGLRDGKGSCSFANKYFSYNGGWAAGVMQGRGTLTLADGSQYDGAFEKGEMTGAGLRRWATGASYSGQFVQGELHGTGVHISAEGAQYDGQWVAGKRHGHGVFMSTSGDRYTGAFVNHRQSGVGTMHYSSGDVFHGEWADNVRSGEGKMTFADGATLSGRWSADVPHGRCSYSTDNGYCYYGDFVRGVATSAATHLAVAAYQEPASLLLLSKMSTAGSAALTAGDGDLCIAVSILPFADGAAPTAPTFSAAVSVPEGSAQIVWDDALTVDIPAGTRRPAVARLELRKGEGVVATASFSLDAPYAPSREAAKHSRTTARLSVNGGGGEAAPIELDISYALALAPLPKSAQAGDETGHAEAVAEDPRGEPADAAKDDPGVAPEEPPSISAIGGCAMPPLALRCLRADDVEIQPAKVHPETHAVEEEAKYEQRLFEVPEEGGRCLGVTLSARVPSEPGTDAPGNPNTTQLKTWHLGEVLSSRDGTAVARLMAPEDAPAGKLQLRICDATPPEVLERLAIPLMVDVVIEVEMEARPSGACEN